MNLGINNNYQCRTNFGCNKINIKKLDIGNKKEILDSLKHEMFHNPAHSAKSFYEKQGFKPYETLPNGITIYYPTSLKEMKEIIAKDSKELIK